MICSTACPRGGLYLRFKVSVFTGQVYIVVGIAAVAFTGFLLMLVILKFGGNSKFGIKGKSPGHLSASVTVAIWWLFRANAARMDS